MTPEIDEGNGYTGYREALSLIFAHVHPLGTEVLEIGACAGRVLAEDIAARVSSPTNHVSLKDGFAIKAADVSAATADSPVRLQVIGSAFAGHEFAGEFKPGTAVKILSGSPLPAGADAVIPSEFCEEVPGGLLVRAIAGVEQNIFPAGGDVKAGETIARKGQVLTAPRLGLIAAGGLDRAVVYRKPRVALLGIGDEVVAPGNALGAGQLYASNLINVGGWLSSFGIVSQMGLAGDSRDAIKNELLRLLPEADAILTSGGAWGSERDLVMGTLDELGWRKLFHHVRMGPGKGVGFGIWQERPVFCLPGGPPSNQMAFLQLALPAVLRMAGQSGHALPEISAILVQDVKRRHVAWTEFRGGKLSKDAGGDYVVTPYTELSRLKSMAEITCLICIPEGVAALKQGQKVKVQLLVPAFSGLRIADR